MADLISVEQARTKIIDAFKPLACETVALNDAHGRVLGETIAARRTQPPVAVSAMDGYAVRACDVATTPISLSVIGEAPAGGAFDGLVGPGQAVRIFTGGPVPKGADAIVLQEETDMGPETVEIKEAPPLGQHIRCAGIDFSEGDELINAGTYLTARHIGLAAAMNYPDLPVTRKPVIALLATGDEIVRPGDPIGPNQIVSSNGPALSALIKAQGGEPKDLGIARDTEDSIRTLIKGAVGTDLLITMGGVSVGDKDLVRKVLSEEGMEINFWRIAMKPGKPLMFGQLGDVPVLGLPGNPVSSLVCAILYLKPAIDHMLGRPKSAMQMTRAILGADLAANNFREDFMRASLDLDVDGNACASPFNLQDSSQMATLARAGCLIHRPANAPPAKAGDAVNVIALSGS